MRNLQNPISVIDILTELERPRRSSLLDLVKLEDYLSDLLGVKVDIALNMSPGLA